MLLAKWIGMGLIIAVSFGAAAEPLGHRADLEEGLWQFHIRYDVMGTPQTFEPYTTTRCLTREDPLPYIQRSGQECRLTPQPGPGRIIRWGLDCSNEAELVHGQGRMHYVRDHGNGQVYVQILGTDSPPYTMAFHVRGERIGACQ